MIVWNELANICRKYGVEYAQLADFCDVSENTIHRIANGTYIPKLSTALKISVYLSTPVEDIFLINTDWYDKKIPF